MIDLAFPLCILLGLVLGIISGLTPGLHVNNFAVILLVLSPKLMAWGLSPLHVGTVILAAAIAQTFFDAIPAIFVGAPEEGTALSVLPGHAMMMDGRGLEAVRLSALGSTGAIIICLLLAWPLAAVFSQHYEQLTHHIGHIILVIATLMIYSEAGPGMDGRGSTARLKYRLLALALFMSSGLLGLFAFYVFDPEQGKIAWSPLGLEPEPLLPLLSGLFGASALVISLSARNEVPEQKETEFSVPPGRLSAAAAFGGVGGAVIAWMPGLSPSIASAAVRLGVASSGEEFLVSVAGANTANALMPLVALYAIDRSRSGAAAAIDEILNSAPGGLSLDILLQMMIAAVAVTIASYVAVISLSKAAADLVSRLNYRALCLCVLSFLAIMTFGFTGPIGILVFIVGTEIGMIAPLAGIRKTHAMGVLMLPLLVRYL